MSMKQHPDAKLFGLEGPFYPTSVASLVTTLDSMGTVTGVRLTARALASQKYQEYTHATALDGYSWFWTGGFQTRTGEVRVAIPWAQDWLRQDGTQFDRSPALYAERGVSEADMDEVVRHFVSLMQA